MKQPSVSGWVRMLARPEQHHRIAIERLLQIPASDWMTDGELAVASGDDRASGPHLPDDLVGDVLRSNTG